MHLFGLEYYNVLKIYGSFPLTTIENYFNLFPEDERNTGLHYFTSLLSV